MMLAAESMCAVAQELRYFGYGSNMFTKRLRERVSSAKPIGIGYVKEHQLRWHKESGDGSGKCDIYFTGDKKHLVYGVLFEISAAEKNKLDKAEGLNNGYNEKKVAVITSSGLVSAVTYYATVTDEQLRPYDWYKRYVVEGAVEHCLPESYVEELKSVESVKDPDHKRERKETSLFDHS